MFHEAGAPKLLVHYPPFGDDKWERLADLAAAGVELTVVVDSRAARRGPRARLRASRARSRTARRARRGPAPHRPDDRSRSSRSARSSRRCPRSTVAGISCYPGHCSPRRSSASRETATGRRASSRNAGRLRPRRPPLRPRLWRLHTDAPAHAHHLHQRVARGDLRTPRPERSRGRPLCALDRSDRRLRLRTRPGRRRRRVEDVHVRPAPRRRPRLRASACPERSSCA